MSSVPLTTAERDDLVDREVVLRFLLSAAFWLVFAPTIGVSFRWTAWMDFLGLLAAPAKLGGCPAIVKNSATLMEMNLVLACTSMSPL